MRMELTERPNNGSGGTAILRFSTGVAGCCWIAGAEGDEKFLVPEGGEDEGADGCTLE
jgi:hypothetical protein